MDVIRKWVLAAAVLVGLVGPAAAAERAIIVLDGSGSMWAQIDGEARISIARETLGEVLAEVPADLELGFLTYGHREKGNCGDIELLVEPAAGSAEAIAAAADAINPKGMTPISDAVRLAAESLRFTEEKATVILITDGLETCEVDPCALASELEGQGIDFTTHVLGFGLSDEEGQQVACLAENTGGQYLSAADGASLVEALTTTVAQVVEAETVEAETVVQPAPEPVAEPASEPVAAVNLKPTLALAEGGPDVTDEMGYVVWWWFKPNAEGGEGEHVGTSYYVNPEETLEAGDYILKVELGYVTLSQPITITEGEVTAPHFVLNAAWLKLHPLPSEGAEVAENASTEIKVDGAYLGTEYGDVRAIVPAGEIEANVTIGEATVGRSYSPAAGETVEEDVVVGVGIADFTAEYVPGTAVVDDIYMEVVESAAALDGTRESVAYGYGGEQDFELAAGDYVLLYELDGVEGELPFSVVTAERTELPVALNAGVLAVSTPTDNYVEIFGASKDIAGNRVSFDYGYGPEFQTTLTAGDYVVYTSKGEEESETPVTITAGQRFELTVEAAPTGGKSKTK